MDTTYLGVIVMDHGFNDNTLINLGTYTMDQFKAAYNEVLDRLKINYPGVPIICMVPFGAQALQPHIESCITGRSYCYLVHTNGWAVTTADEVHPNVADSIILKKLSNEIM